MIYVTFSSSGSFGSRPAFSGLCSVKAKDLWHNKRKKVSTGTCLPRSRGICRSYHNQLICSKVERSLNPPTLFGHCRFHNDVLLFGCTCDRQHAFIKSTMLLFVDMLLSYPEPGLLDTKSRILMKEQDGVIHQRSIAPFNAFLTRCSIPSVLQKLIKLRP